MVGVDTGLEVAVALTAGKVVTDEVPVGDVEATEVNGDAMRHDSNGWNKKQNPRQSRRKATRN